MSRQPFVRTLCVPVVCALSLSGAVTAGAAERQSPLSPVTVCQVLTSPDQFAGKTVLVLGRFSFRASGRFLSQDKCPGPGKGGEGVLRIVMDRQDGPAPPDSMSVDTRAVDRELEAMQKSTTLASFRFGSSDYDRWSLVYARFEPPPKEDKPAASSGSEEFSEARARLLCRGEALVIFLRDRQ